MLKDLLKQSSLIIVLLVVLGQTVSEAQVAQRRLEGDSFMLSPNNNVSGDPFIFKEWRTATLHDTKGNVIEGVVINYDALKEVMICKRGSDEYIQLNKYMYTLADFGKEKYYNLTPFGALGYGRAIYFGENIKCFYNTKASKTTNDSKSYSQVKSHYKITKRNVTLLWIEGTVHEIKRKEKEFIRLFPDKNVNSIIKQNKLKIKKDADLSKLLSLLEQ